MPSCKHPHSARDNVWSSDNFGLKMLGVSLIVQTICPDNITCNCIGTMMVLITLNALSDLHPANFKASWQA